MIFAATGTTLAQAFSVDFSRINWLAVAAAAFAAFMVGGIWYGGLFGPAWQKAHGFTEAQIADMKAKMNPAKFFGGMFAAYIPMAIAIAILIARLETGSVMGGVRLGLVLWVIVAAVNFTHHIASGKVLAAFLIDAGCELVYLPAMGALLAVWR